ncbi:MAG: hypothetical protein IPL22_18750 [Bacteroidetes bacterium]|nr:hypothetical protein [Bacteroidota bacterium]
MRIIACCLLVLVLTTNLKSQNLCPNPGFEQLSGCPAGPKEITLAQPWVATGDTADLFSFCHVNGTTPGCNDVSVPVNFAGQAPAHGAVPMPEFTRRNRVPINERICRHR